MCCKKWWQIHLCVRNLYATKLIRPPDFMYICMRLFLFSCTHWKHGKEAIYICHVTNLFPVHNYHGYIKIVSRVADTAPNVDNYREVLSIKRRVTCVLRITFQYSSGSSLMQNMTPQSMPTTPRYTLVHSVTYTKYTEDLSKLIFLLSNLQVYMPFPLK